MSYVSKLINYLKNINKKIKKTCHVSKIKVEKKDNAWTEKHQINQNLVNWKQQPKKRKEKRFVP